MATLSSAASAATFNWSNNTTGNWSSSNLTTDWKSATVPNAAGAVVRYTHSGGGSLSGTVTLDMNAIVGIIDHQTGVGGSTGIFTVAKSGSFALTMDNTGGPSNSFGNTNAAIVGIGNANASNITQVQPDIIIANTDLDIGSVSGGVLIGTSANSSNITATTNQNLNIRWNGGNAARPMTINAGIGNSGAGNITLNHVGTGAATETTLMTGTIGVQVTSISQNTTQATLNITGSNTAFAGTTNLQAGTLQANNANALGSTGNITFSGGALQYTAASAGQNWAARFKNSTAGPISLGTNGQTVSLTAIDSSNTGGLTKLGTGTLNLNGANAYTGDTRSNAGTLAVGNVDALSASTLDMNAADAGAITFTVVGTNTYNLGELNGTRALGIALNSLSIGATNLSSSYSGNLSSSGGGLTKAGTGTLVLAGTNSYSGITTVNAGALQFAKQVALYNNVTASWTDTNLVVESGATAAFNVGGSGEFTASDLDLLKALGTPSGGFKSGATLGIDTTNAGGSFTYSSTIADPNAGANALGLSKSGSGALILEGANTYTGPTLVTAGTLVVNGSGSLNSSSSVTVSTGATLTNNSTALTTALGLDEGATLSGSSSFTPSALAITGDLTGGAFAAITLDSSLTKTGALAFTLTNVVDGSYSLFSGTAPGGSFASVSVGGTPLVDQTGGIFSAEVGGFNYTYDDNLNNLGIAAIPEPATWVMVVLGLTFLLYRRRVARGMGVRRG